MDDQIGESFNKARRDANNERAVPSRIQRPTVVQATPRNWFFDSTRGHQEPDPINRIAGKSQMMTDLRARILRYAETEETVLISGETGTGKELIARIIHDLSNRSKSPFVAVNCAAIPAQLAESELFGSTRGAYTGAVACRRGLLSRADGGTLFLDEFGELATGVQSKLLRALEFGAYRPVGANQEARADVRVIAATNRDLEASVYKGEFRADLFYRINVLRIVAPPLRKHRCDIPEIIGEILDELLPRGSRIQLTDAVMTELLNAPWPGNVRELKNLLRRSLVMSREGVIDSLEGASHPCGKNLENFCRQCRSSEKLIESLTRNKGRLEAVANELNVSVRTVQRRIKETGLSLKDFRRI